MMIKKRCKNCEKVMEVHDCLKERKKFCSMRCRRAYHSDGYIKDGYKKLYIGGSYKEEHRIIAEKAIGRPLTKDEHVHHINGNKLDNRNSNLLICTNSYHRQLHERMTHLYQQSIEC